MTEVVVSEQQPTRKAATVAFIGLGTMGYPMAGHLARAGHRVRVYNRTASRASAWCAAYPGEAAGSPRVAAAGADVVFTCVGNDADVRSVVLGDSGAFAAMRPAAVLVDCSTASAVLARELFATARQRGLGFIDAPVSGGQAGAERGQLTVMCGGEGVDFALIEPIASAFAKSVTLLGPPGSGQLAKMVNQLCIAGLVQGLAEGLAFGARAGLDMPRVLEVISKGAAQSWQLDNRGPTMLADEFDFGFAVDWMRKDLGICFEEAARNGSDIPVARLVDGFYAELQAEGGGRLDTSSLIRRLTRRGGAAGNE
jgi:3-hydroxyisobutyrate dehydrogenase